MCLLFYLTFISLIFITTYYFIYLENLNHNNLFYIILNFLFIIILPIYYYYFEDLIYSLIINIILSITSFILNLEIKKIFNHSKILPLINFFLINIILFIIINDFFAI